MKNTKTKINLIGDVIDFMKDHQDYSVMEVLEAGAKTLNQMSTLSNLKMDSKFQISEVIGIILGQRPDYTLGQILGAGCMFLDGVVKDCPNCGCSELLCGYDGNQENCSSYEGLELEVEKCDKCLRLYGHCSCD